MAILLPKKRRRMKKVLLAVAVTLAIGVTACTPSKVDGGVEGVLTKQPYIFGSGGVDPTPIKTGLTWTALSTKVDRYNTKPVRYTENFIDLTASDNVAIDFDSYLTLKIISGKTPKLHELSGKNWYVNKVQDYYRQAVRNELRTRSSIDLRTNPQVITETQTIILDIMQKYIAEIELPVKVVKVVTGKVIPPNELLKEAAKTAAEKQKIKTQEARILTEEKRALAETNAALADKAYADEFNMNTEQFLRNKQLDIMAMAVETGEVNLIINASNAQPMFKVGK